MLMALLHCKQVADERLARTYFLQVRKIVQAIKLTLLAKSSAVSLIEERYV
jgi:hypothetical protein